MLGLNVRTDGESQQNSSQTLKSQIIWLTIGLLRQEKTARVGIKVKRLKAAWDTRHLLRVLEATSSDAIALFLCCCATWIQCTGDIKTALLHFCIEKVGEQVI